MIDPLVIAAPVAVTAPAIKSPSVDKLNSKGAKLTKGNPAYPQITRIYAD